MRLAFVGKGGVGKSALAGTFVRLLARRGHDVLAVDSDPMPGLAFSIGVERSDDGIPDDAVVERGDDEPGPRFRLRDGLDAAAAIERYAAMGPDGVRFLQFGKLTGHVSQLMRSQFAFRQILEELPAERWSVVGDLPGGTRQPFTGWADFAHTVLVVAEPTAKSVLAARRLARLALVVDGPAALGLVVNKVRDRDDAERVSERTGLPLVASVPWDEELAKAERLGRPPVDEAPGCPAVQAIGSLIDELTGGDRPCV